MVKKRGENAMKIIKDLRRRSQLLLDKQLEHQRSLLQRLESGNFFSQSFGSFICICTLIFLYLFIFYFTRNPNRSPKRETDSHH